MLCSKFKATKKPQKRSQLSDMVHGWMTRGGDDPMLPQPAGAETVRQAQASALQLAAEFFRDLAKSEAKEL